MNRVEAALPIYTNIVENYLRKSLSEKEPTEDKKLSLAKEALDWADALLKAAGEIK